MNSCAACRRPLEEGARFCPYCGFRLGPITAAEHARLSAEPDLAVDLDTEGPGAAGPRTASDQDRRRAARFPIKVEVDYTSDHNFYTGFLENISAGGLFIATHRPAEIGEELEVSFTVPGLERTCLALCRVRWVREVDTPDAPAGIGCQFRQLDPEACAAIALFARHRAPLFFD